MASPYHGYSSHYYGYPGYAYGYPGYYYGYPGYWGSPYGYYGPWSWSFGVSFGGGGYGYGYGGYPYAPYGYYGGGWPYYWGGSVQVIEDHREDEPRSEPMGSLRLRVSPANARVYVDGALAGIVDEFDGLTNHLSLPAGRHQIEFRLDGYETFSLEVLVEAGKTRTERASLRKR